MSGKIIVLKKRVCNKIIKVYRESKNEKKLKKYMLSPKGNKFIIPGTPTHSNLGDSAIVIAQMLFLKKMGVNPNQIKEITFDEYYKYRDLMKRIIGRDDLIVSLGGGNMGNQWPAEEKFRYDLLNDFYDNHIIIFPQTIHYIDTATESAYQKQKESIEHYDNHKKIVLIAREQKSYNMMETLYKKTKVLLTPDIVLSTQKEDYGVKSGKREGVLLCIRSDAEKAVSESDWDAIKRKMDDEKVVYNITDMHSKIPVTKENRMELVSDKMQGFCNSKLVITDRLHGMIFAAITETPCIVFSNYNHKVRGTYEWIKELPYIRYAENINDAMNYIDELIGLDDSECIYDNGKWISCFEVIKEEIENATN